MLLLTVAALLFPPTPMPANAVFGIFAQGFDSPTVAFGSHTLNGNVQDVSGAFPNGSMHK